MPLQMSHEVPAPVALLNSGPPILAGVLGVGGHIIAANVRLIKDSASSNFGGNWEVHFCRRWDVMIIFFVEGEHGT